MSVLIQGIWDNFTNFIGGRGGLVHWLLYCAAVAVCFFIGKKERRFLFWPAVLVLLFFFNPLFYRYIGTKFLSGIYWRLLWMLPIAITTAFVIVRLIYRLHKNTLRIAAAVFAVCAVITSGTCIYGEGTFQKAENDYKLPQAALDVSEAMAAAGVDWKVRAIVPNELLCYIRQCRCDVGLYYGRNIGGFIHELSEEEQKVYGQMSSEKPDVALIAEIARANDVVFLCFNTEAQEIPEEWDGYGYELYKTVGIYRIYIREGILV